MSLSEATRARIVTLDSHSSLKQKAIAQLCGVSQASVSKILKRFRLTASFETIRLGRCGRKRKTSERADRLLLIKSKKNPRLTSEGLRRVLLEHGIQVSSKTVRRRLEEFNRPARRPVKRQMLTSRMKKARFEWAKQHQHWTVDDWKKVSFIKPNHV